MSRSRQQRMMLAGLGLLIFVASATGQTQQKVLLWSDHPQGSHGERPVPPLQIFRQLDAIEIQSIDCQGKSITIGEPFAADDDWLKHLTFRVKNVSDAELTGIQITLHLPELAQQPQIPYFAGCYHNKNQPCIRPGEVVELKMPVAGLYDWLKKIVASETELRKITKATIYFGFASLPGDIRWSSGCVKTKDPRQACPEHVH